MNSDCIVNVLETVKFVFCLQIHALAERTLNSKFCIMYEAAKPMHEPKIIGERLRMNVCV